VGGLRRGTFAKVIAKSVGPVGLYATAIDGFCVLTVDYENVRLVPP
jgi:hypothetical protein